MSKAQGIAQSANQSQFKNRIINGNMAIDQRNAGASVTPTATTYTLDRWSLEISQASKLTMQQNAGSVTPPTGFKYYLGITTVSAYSVTASDQFQLRQFIEGFNVADLGWGTANASTVTLSFWVRSSLTGTFGGAFRNEANNRSYPFSYTISAANTWEQKTITVAGDTTGTWLTNNDRGIAVLFGLGVGSDKSGTSGSWAAANYTSATGATSVVGTNGATFYITGVQLEKGTVATSFDYRPYGTELALCQRYFVSWGGQPTSATYNYFGLGVEDGSGAYVILNNPVPFRAVPTLTVLNLSNTSSYAGAGGVTPSAASIDVGTPLNTGVRLTYSGTVGRACRWLALGSDLPRVQLSAEL